MHTQTGRGTAPFEWVNGTARYRALPVEHRRISIANDTFEIAALKDAAPRGSPKLEAKVAALEAMMSKVLASQNGGGR